MDILTLLLFIIVCALIFTYLYHYIKTFRAQQKVAQKWPPAGYPLQCPDYWTRQGNQCINTFNLTPGLGGKLVANMPVPPLSSSPQDKCEMASRNKHMAWFGTKSESCVKGSDCYC
jgi:hypothetical protein